MDNNLPVIIEELPAVAGDNLIAIAEAAEKRIAAVKRIKAAALAVTNAHDWVDQSGKPYLQVSGAEKVARLFGISWRLDEPTIYQEEDGHYSYNFKGYFAMSSGAEIEIEGSRSSRDPFFSKSGDSFRPISEIDRNDVRKGAMTNCIGNGVTRLLGIRNLTWEEVESAGINRGKTSSVKYAQTSEKTDQQKERIRDMVLEMVGGDMEKARAKLKELTAFKGDKGEVAGKETVDELTVRQIPVVYGKVEKAHEEWEKTLDGLVG